MREIDHNLRPLDPGAYRGNRQPPVAVREVALSTVDEAGRAAWARLADRAAEPNPYYRPDFVQAVAAADGSDPLLLIVTSGDDWVFCLPVERAPHWRRVRVSCLVPWKPAFSFLGVPLVDRDRVGVGARALASYLTTARRDAAIVLDPIDPDGLVGTGLSDAFREVRLDHIVYAEWRRGALHQRPEPTYLDEAMKGRRRKELRRLRRALEREVGEVVTVDRSGDPAAWETFMRIERDGWKGGTGTALASTPEGTAFFRGMCQTAADEGRLQILALEAGGRTVAMQCNLVDGEALFGFKVTYDEALATYSPGALLEVEAIGIFHDSPSVKSADSCAAPDSEVINRIWPDRRRLQTLVVPTASLRASLIGPSIAAEAAGRRVARALRERRSAVRVGAAARS